MFVRVLAMGTLLLFPTLTEAFEQTKEAKILQELKASQIAADCLSQTGFFVTDCILRALAYASIEKKDVADAFVRLGRPDIANRLAHSGFLCPSGPPCEKKKVAPGITTTPFGGPHPSVPGSPPPVTPPPVKTTPSSSG